MFKGFIIFFDEVKRPINYSINIKSKILFKSPTIATVRSDLRTKKSSVAMALKSIQGNH